MKSSIFFLTALLLSPTMASAHEHGHTEIAATETTSNQNAQPEVKKPEEVQVTVQKIGENIHFLHGNGGNIAVSVGKDGIFVIDSDYAEITPTVIKAIKTISDQPIKYLINTHWHGDHTGGNEYIGNTGTIILSHDNVRKHLMVENYIPAFDMKMPAAPEIALPSLTFDHELSVHMNGEEVRLIHIDNAHTDSDIIVHFSKSNIIHTGDLFFNGFYPFIDAATGGSLEGMITGSDVILALSDENTKIIPGHGLLATKAELQSYRDMLTAVQAKLKPMLDAGKTVEEIAATNPLEEFNATWGDGVLPPEKWLGIVVEAMKSKEK